MKDQDGRRRRCRYVTESPLPATAPDESGSMDRSIPSAEPQSTPTKIQIIREPKTNVRHHIFERILPPLKWLYPFIAPSYIGAYEQTHRLMISGIASGSQRRWGSCT